VVIPEAEEFEVTPRRFTTAEGADYLPYAPGPDLVPDMTAAGMGHRIHTTGLTHDERGYPVMTAEAQDLLVNRLAEKITRHAGDIIRVEEDGLDGAEVVVVSYGITSRVSRAAIQQARDEGLPVGGLRLVTLWPFAEEYIRRLAGQVRGFVVPEINLGQMSLEVERCAAGRAVTLQVPHAGGWVHDPKDIYQAIVEVLQ